MANNKLSRIDDEILRFWSKSSKIRKLDLNNNPWKCDCEAKTLWTFVRSNARLIKELQTVTCDENNKIFVSTYENDLCPSPILVIVISLLAFMIVVLIFTILYFHNRQKIKEWLFSKNLCMFWVSEEEIDKDKTYDAFISFSHQDEEFVIEELVDKLESGTNSYKLCIHVRDWPAGEWIPNQIINSVKESRRTIIIMSKNFVRSEWGKMEFLVAQQQAQNEKRNRVVIIMYEELDSTATDLYPELKNYLKMNTYIKWSDPWFWNKLFYALPHKRRQKV